MNHRNELGRAGWMGACVFSALWCGARAGVSAPAMAERHGPAVVGPADAVPAEAVPAEVVPAAGADSPYRQALKKMGDVPLLLLDPGDKVWELQVTSGAHLTVGRGNLMVNSSNDGAFWAADGTIEVSHGAIGVAGGTNLMGQPVVQPEPRTGMNPIPDPFPAFRVTPPTNVVSATTNFLHDETVTLPPGIYKGGIFAGGTVKHIKLLPGVYVMVDGDFFSAGARIEGQGVTIVLSGAKPGALWGSNGTSFDLSAPTEGPLEGLLVVSRGEGSEAVRLSATQGELNGTIYAPGAGFTMSGESDVSVTRLVCANLGLTLNANLEVTGADVPDAPAGGGAGQ